MLSAMPSTSPSVNTLITLDDKEISQNAARRMTLDQTKSFSGAFLAEACGIVEELDGLAANMTSSPLVSPERRVSPDRRMTLGPDMDLLDVENMNDSLLSSLAIANSPVKKPAVSTVPSPLPGPEVKVKALTVPAKAVDCTYDRLAQLLNETQDIVSGPAAAALGRAGDVKPGAVNSTFLQSNNQKLLNSTFDREQPPAEEKLANNPNANATFDQKHMIAATNQTFDRLEHQMAANTTFEMPDNLINTTFDRKENQQANTTFDFQAEAKNEY
ncbi:uncharacterized protein LOC134781825 [Penaeus indicus]|uniref:uncharacterized protein LOC134781825 n=1 Tax=Penaeus indicus TaxID=29960 RepID=UPI00300C8296